MNKNRTCPPEFIGENRDPRRYPAPNTPPKPKFIDALEITDDTEQYSTPVKKDPKTGLLYSNAEHLVKQSDAKHEAEEERLDDLIDEETKNRYAHVMAIDEVNQHRVNEEKAARESQDTLLGDRIDRHEVKVNELHVEANRVHNSKLDKNFSNAEISTLPVSSSDYVVIVSNGNTYRVTLEQLAILISQKTDYYKGQYGSLEDLNKRRPSGEGGDYAYVDTPFEDENGNITYQFVMYVYDVEEQRWEQTASSQYATQADYTALVQSLLDGTFNLGSIKVNESPLDSPLLQSLHVNQKDYTLPSVELEFSDQPVEGGYSLGSITVNGSKWNISGGSGNVIADTEMSDTSTNPVQNKVVKKYIDDKFTTEISNALEGEY